MIPFIKTKDTIKRRRALLQRTFPAFRRFDTLMTAMKGAGTIQKHYERFPKNPEDIPQWKTKARELWAVR